MSSLNKFSQDSIESVSRAAKNEGGASHFAISCDVYLIRIAKSFSSLPICVTSVLSNTQRLVAAVTAGTPLSVTIPHSLPLIDQISPAKELETQGAELLQTDPPQRG
jgi:hypothetical protein